MKALKFILLTLIAVITCGTMVNAENKSDAAKVEVIVFHGVRQCETCKAIKKNTEEVVKELKNADVVYRVVDFSQESGKAEAEKYKVAWTSLIIVKHEADGKETVNNLSQFAIKNARTNTDEFRKQLATDINKLLK